MISPERARHRFHRFPVDQRAHQYTFFQRVSDLHLPVRRDKQILQFVENGVMDNEPSYGGAALPRRTDSSEKNRPERKFQVRTRGDDNRVVSTEFQKRLPSLARTPWPTRLPMGTLPVAEMSGSLLSATIRSPMSSPLPITTFRNPFRKTAFRDYPAAMEFAARAQSGTLLDGFQTTVSPAISASMAFQAQTATGKLNAVMTPIRAKRMVLFEHAMPRPFAVHGKSVEHSRLADCKIANIDQFLDFAFPLGQYFPHFQGDEGARVPFCAPGKRLLSCRTTSPRLGAGTSRATAEMPPRPPRTTLS